MPPPPPPEGTAPLERWPHWRDSYGALPRAQRELVIFGLALLCGLIVMPFLIWFAGSRVLGPYTHGQNAHAGPFALAADFFLGLVHGSAVFWAVALGPAGRSEEHTSELPSPCNLGCRLLLGKKKPSTQA